MKPIVVTLLLVLASSTLPGQSHPTPPRIVRAPEWRHDFDFWIGAWDVQLRTLQKDNSWKDSVQAKAEIYSVLGGKAILELWDSPKIKGFSLRYYDVKQNKWVLYLNWPGGNQSSIGTLTGNFRHGRGEFFASSKSSDGQTSISRYTFSDIKPDSLRWDDAYSKDSGRTWTHNWIMEFTRTAPLASWPKKNSAHTFESGGRCQGAEFDKINSIAGRWRGEATVTNDGRSVATIATLTAYRVLDGCSLVWFLEYDHHQELGLLTYNRGIGQYDEVTLDNVGTAPARSLRGPDPTRGATITLAPNPAQTSDGVQHEWTLPSPSSDASSDTLQFRRLEVSTLGQGWTVSFAGQFERVPYESTDEETEKVGTRAINSVCPRSGKAVAADSLTVYRGHTVGFCNPHCRDDFAADPKLCPGDRAFFDRLIDAK